MEKMYNAAKDTVEDYRTASLLHLLSLSFNDTHLQAAESILSEAKNKEKGEDRAKVGWKGGEGGRKGEA